MSFKFTAICLFFIRISFITVARTDTTKVPIYGDSSEFTIPEKKMFVILV